MSESVNAKGPSNDESVTGLVGGSKIGVDERVLVFTARLGTILHSTINEVVRMRGHKMIILKSTPPPY